MCRSFILPKQPSTMISPPTTAIVGNSSSPDNSSSSSHATTTNNKSLTQHISLLHGIMRSQRWPAFENIVLSNPAVFDMLSNAIPTHEEFNSGTTLLHACLRYKPSFNTIVKMVRMISSSSDATAALRALDGKGRTPLHIAAASDCDPMVLKFLGHADPTTCSIVDADGRTPLHRACDSSCTIEEQQAVVRQKPSYDGVRALLSESLAVTLVEDQDGMSPLEYAIMSDASIEVVTLLQKATMESSVRKTREEQQPTKKRRLLDSSAQAEVTCALVEERSVVRKVSCQL